MKTVLYSAIRLTEGQSLTDIIRTAHALGYELVRFNGWTNEDLGHRYGEYKGARRDEADANAKMIREIQDACEVTYEDGSYGFPHIIQGNEIPNGYIVG